MTEPVPAARAGRRGYAVALVLLLAGAGLMLLAYGRVWVTARVGDAGLPTLQVDLTGRDLQPEGTAAALVALAGIAALVATRRVGRLATGIVLVVLGLATAMRAVQFAARDSSSVDADATVGRLVAERTGVGATGLTVSHSSWWAVACLGAVLVMLAGVVVLRRSRTWPVLGGRYERAGAGAGAGDPAPARTELRTDSAWDQLDRGVDPTDDTASDPTLRGGAEA